MVEPGFEPGQVGFWDYLLLTDSPPYCLWGWIMPIPCPQGVYNSIERKKESEVAQSCPTLCDPMDYSLPGSSIHGIFQARILEWIAISLPRVSSWTRDGSWISRIAGKTIYHLSHQGSPCLSMKLKVKLLSHIWLFATPWTIAYQAPPSMGFSRQEYWSGLPFPSPGESSRPRDRTRVSRTPGRRFNRWDNSIVN